MTELSVVVPAPLGGVPPKHAAAVLDGMDVSEATRTQYRREIRHFLQWLDAKPLYPNILLDFKKHLRHRSDIGAGTKAKYLAVARAFLRELYRLGVIPADVTAGVKSIKVSRLHKRAPISEADIRRAVDFIEDAKADARERLILALFLYQGLRRVELSRLRVEDFDRDEQTLLVLGKGADDKVGIDLHPRAIAVLLDYLGSSNLKSGPMFPSPVRPDHGLSSHAIWRIAMRVHQKLGIEGKTVHGWRKTFTTRLIQTGMNLLEVQSYTRHASISMLQVYYQRMEKTKTLPLYYSAFPST